MRPARKQARVSIRDTDCHGFECNSCHLFYFRHDEFLIHGDKSTVPVGYSAAYKYLEKFQAGGKILSDKKGHNGRGQGVKDQIAAGYVRATRSQDQITDLGMCVCTRACGVVAYSCEFALSHANI